MGYCIQHDIHSIYLTMQILWHGGTYSQLTQTHNAKENVKGKSSGTYSTGSLRIIESVKGTRN